MDRKFRDDVYKLVSEIPRGKIMTYSQIAALCSHPNAARTVGQIAHFGPDNLPWQRVVHKNGSMARGYPLGPGFQAKLLVDEGIIIENNKVNVEDYLWWPKK